MEKILGTIGVMLFALGGSLEASPDAPWRVVLIPYGIIAAGLALIFAAIWLHCNYHFGSREDEYV